MMAYSNTFFSQKDVASEFIEKSLPIEIVKNIDLSTLELDNSNYTDNKLKRHYADLVYDCKFRNSDIKKNRNSKKDVEKRI